MDNASKKDSAFKKYKKYDNSQKEFFFSTERMCLN